MIRWKRVLSALAAIGILFLLIVLLIDPFLKWVITKTGQAVFGARVDIASVTFKFRKTSLNIHGVQIADKADPMKNLLEWKDATFDARALPLLEKKVIIDRSALTELRFGTVRKTSGALSAAERRPGFVGKAVSH